MNILNITTSRYDWLAGPGRNRGPATATAFLLIMALALVIGCRPATPEAPAVLPLPDGERALAEVIDFIALGPRDSGTSGAEKAALYLRDRLTALEIEAMLDIFEDPAPIGPATFRNVLGVIPGSGPHWIVLGSHYDTKAGIAPDFIGANDSGSSTGLLLELGRVLRAGPRPQHNILLAFFDGEECMERYGPGDGLHGSRHLAAALRQDGRAALVEAVIIIDMIGDRDLTVTIPRNGAPWLTASALRAAARADIRHKFKLLQTNILDDHQPFLDAGMPAMVLIDFEFGSVPGRNDYWHTVEDTADKLCAGSLRDIGRVVMYMLEELKTFQ
ncbi:MAG: M28 family metallopeptidase [Kiritimatiellia bacterium]|nr:M28 family peptidase [Lentisphaerota bacterium]